MLRHAINTLRLLRIGWVLARHNALFPLQATRFAPFTTLTCTIFCNRSLKLRPGQRLANALQKLGPSYIKLGQTLSTRADLVGEDIARDLGNLRDQIPAFPFQQAKTIIEEEFDAPLEELFTEFDPTPVAAASIAQVHFAVTRKEGREVAVKIIRPDVKAAFARDLSLFRWVAEILSLRPEIRRLKPVEVVETFAESVEMELDLRFEAAAAAELRENMADDPHFVVPEVYWPLTSARTLTLERIMGTKISHLDKLREEGHDFHQLVTIAAEAFFRQVFRDGYFHADLHPGNLFALKDGRIAVVDFGIMGRVGWQERVYLAEILRGFLEGDYRKVAQMHFDAGYVPAHKNVDHFTVACRAIGEPIMGLPLDQISVARLLAQLFAVAETFEMQTQPQLLLLQKTMMVAEGVGRMLVPNVNMWQLAEPLITDWAVKNLGPTARLSQLKTQATNLAERLPIALKHAENLLKKADTGGIKLHPSTVESLLRERRRNSDRWLLLGWTALIILTTLVMQNL